MIRIHQEKPRPIFIVEWLDKLTEKDVETYIRRYTTILKRNQAYVMIIDLTGSKKESPIDRKRILKKQREWLVENEALLNDKCLGKAYIADTLASQAAQRARIRINPTPYPSVVFSKQADALAWASSRLAK